MDKDDYVDKRGKKTQKNFTSYTIKDAIFNWAEELKKIPVTTLMNGWCNLLKTPKTPPLKPDFEGLEPSTVVQMLTAAEHGDIAEDEMEEWLDEPPPDQGGNGSGADDARAT